MNSLENTTSPLVLKEAVDNEYDFLNSEITRFALQSMSDISEDGSIEGSVASYTFKQPVSYTTYTVKSGDTISGISKRFGLKNISTIIAVNNIENVRSLNAGKKLTIPSVDGLFYKVKGGDSVQSIAKKYDVTVEDLLDVNDLDSELLVAGNNLFIPGAKLDKTTLHRALGDTFTNPLRNVKWRLTSRCGWRANPFTGVKQYHPGIDMAISQGTPIYAALNGKVVACGWSNIYGNYVIIDHGNGYQSLYGHMYKKLCTLNQEVSTSTKIGLVGSTGYSTGAHLHFTVYKNGKVVDPLTLIK
ncbi:MAG: M23 family metallopeptidase [Treponema sp.]|nr:M23 family metallopeptidase [Treponema sp.]